MQFGRLLGTLLMALGIILLAMQFFFVTKPQQDVRVRPQPAPASSEHRTNPWPGIAGGASLFAGFLIFVTARRNDQPDPRHAIK
jgi:hypothetical protein